MDLKLEHKLYKKYPKLFKQRKLSMDKTAMCWGCQHGNGWYWLLDNLCSYLAFQVKENGMPNVEFTTVKEKYGWLRIYFQGGNEETRNVIRFVSELSYVVCENCGSMDDVRDIGSKCYIQRYCKKCRKPKWGIFNFLWKLYNEMESKWYIISQRTLIRMRRKRK